MNVLKNSMDQFAVFRQRFGAGSMMKSTQEKLERQQKTQSQIDYWESRKDGLKQMDCDTVEEIAKKLELFHSYEDEIKEAKKAYNFEQMRHVLDEAEEQGKKIAEAAEKSKPKTEEERKEEAIKEATGTENTGGILEDLLEELPEELESLQEELEKGLEEELPEKLEKLPEEPEKLENLPEEPESLLEELEKGLEEELPEELEKELKEELPEELENLPGELENLPEKGAEELAKDMADSRGRQLAKERYANTLYAEETDKGAWLNYRM